MFANTFNYIARWDVGQILRSIRGGVVIDDNDETSSSKLDSTGRGLYVRDARIQVAVPLYKLALSTF